MARRMNGGSLYRSTYTPPLYVRLIPSSGSSPTLSPPTSSESLHSSASRSPSSTSLRTSSPEIIQLRTRMDLGVILPTTIDGNDPTPPTTIQPSLQASAIQVIRMRSVTPTPQPTTDMSHQDSTVHDIQKRRKTRPSHVPVKTISKPQPNISRWKRVVTRSKTSRLKRT